MPVLNIEEIRIASSFVLNHYSWTSQDKPETRLTLTMPLVVRENGSMLLEYNVMKDDPLYEQGYLLNGSLNVHFSN